MIGIYKITSPSQKIYIGKSKNIKKRFSYYKNLHCKGQIKLYNSFVCYGVETHIFEIIEQCDEDMLNERELYWQEHYNVVNNGLNCIIYDSHYKNLKQCEESATRRSESKKGEKNPMFGKKGNLHHNFNKKTTNEHKKLLSEKSGKSKIVLNVENGIFYKSLVEACEVYNLNYGTMMNRLQGYRKNTTSLIFV